ncbi:hypothetical protein GCM10023091_28740 [Ravibacter arvi]|uniref:CshA domain-containing protein n=1 Tax=Ravibacter arvi TaxID=2051041 RepID=A0ABP8M0Y2_9BACT
MTFTPGTGFTGNPTPIQYTITDSGELTSAPTNITVTYLLEPPVANNDISENNAAGTTVALNILTNDLISDGSPATTTNTSVTLTNTGLPEGSIVAGNTVTVPGEGVWTYDPATGNLTFDPDTEFTNNPTPLTYTLTETATGLSSNAIVTITFSSLPVTLIAFDGKTTAEGVVLTWSTANEADFDRFVIEKSVNPKAGFIALAEISAGNGKYAYTDTHTGSGNTYYRLKMIDIDASFEYSRIISVQPAKDVNAAFIYPNPAVGKTFRWKKSIQPDTFRLLDPAGNVVPARVQEQADSFEFSVRGAQPGLYVLECIANGKTYRYKLIVD